MSGNKTDDSEILNSIFLGEVASVHNYGAFVRIPGNRNQGLVHKSQVSKSVVDDVTEVLQRGERVWCKVIALTDDGKISLSMKVVNQGNGKDLDPNGVQIQQDEMRRKTFVPGSRKQAIQLEAVLKTTCSKCHTYGHLAKDCFKSPGGKTYELIPEDDNLQDVVTSIDQQSKCDQSVKTEKKKKKKHKKEKLHKKKKKKKYKKKRKHSSSSSDSSSESSEEEHEKKSTAKKKRKLNSGYSS